MFRKYYNCGENSKRLICYILVCIAILDLVFVSLVIRSRISVVINVRQRASNTSSEVQQHLHVNNRFKQDSVIDMVNGYHPYLDFKFEFPEIMPVVKGHRDLFLIVLVNSAAKGEMYQKRRAKIRETWGNMNSCEQLRATKNIKMRNLKWILVFILGKAGPGTNDDELNIEEAKQHNDILIGNIKDNYFNNIIKLYMAQLWASTFGPKYTLKTDDDVYVRIPSVIEFLAGLKFPSRFYGGAISVPARRIVLRDPNDRWGISKKYFTEDFWPPYPSGAFILLSSDLLRFLFNYVHIRKPFHIDDAYVGLAMRHFKVKDTKIPQFVVKERMTSFKKKRRCDILAIIAFGHRLDVHALNTLHQRLQFMCKNNITVVSCESKKA